MRRLGNGIKLIFSFFLMGFFLLFAPLPTQNASAQNMPMDHSEAANLGSGVYRNGDRCGPCTATSVAKLSERRNVIVENLEQDPEPPDIISGHQFATFSIEASEPSASTDVLGGLIHRPPDLVILNVNLRI